MPEDAIFGVIYQALQADFEDYTTKIQPISQIPLEIRNSDPNMRYQPTHQIIKENLSIGIGFKSIIFSNRAPYKGWKAFKNFALKVLDIIYHINVVKKIERIGLRYINIVDRPLADASNLVISLCGNIKDKNDVSTLRLEKNIGEEALLILQLNDNVLVSINNSAPKKLSMIDIDSITNHKMDSSNLSLEKTSSILDKLHITEKEFFFNLLKDDYITELNPVYAE